MIRTIKTKQFKITAFVLALVLTLSCVAWNATRVHAQELEITGANSQGFATYGSRAGVPVGTLNSGALSFWFNIQGENTPKYVATNEKWVYDATQGWKFEITNNDNTQLLWKGVPNTGKYYAVYPYSETYSTDPATPFSVTLNADQNTEEKLLASDLLWAEGEARTNYIDIEFAHMMSKFVINLTRGTEVTESSQIANITISGVPLEHAVSLKDWSVTGNNPGKITPLQIDAADGCMASYEAIVSPSTYAPALVITMKDGRTFTTTISQQTFASGTQYNINLQVGQDKVTLGNITAEPWGNPVDGGDLETE